MPPQIKILPEALANQIAAGEVVERPASVVKELMENSIDAGATAIFIEVENGGKRAIRVTDNGCGMSHDDAFLCLERHATSKIIDEGDLFALHSLGFRGEALPAIASVSRFRLQTRNADEETGWQIYAEGGNIRQAEAVGAPRGTVIEVRNLFFNTPARRKFLRRDETEFGHIADVVNRLMMARPDIHVRLSHGGRVHLEAYRHQHLEERVANLMSRTMVADMLPLSHDSGDGEMLNGLLGKPSLSRSNASYIYTYVNGRFVRDRVIQHAVMDAYRTLLERRRYPVVVLFLDIVPELVDVNVHPTKHEVRFRDQGRVHDFIRNGIRETLQAGMPASWAVERHPPVDPASVAPACPDALSTVDPASPEDARLHGVQEALRHYRQKPPVSFSPSAKGEVLQWPTEPPADQGQAAPAGWRLIGQYLNSYLLCQVGEDLVVIDQHAAHERIGFEKLKSQFDRSGIEQQDLLMPLVIELDHREAASVGESLDTLARLGFTLEAFGGRTIIVKSVPQMLAGSDIERLLRNVAAELTESGRASGVEEAFDAILTLMACHGMVRARQPLSRAEMEALLTEMSRIDFSGHCPHGRPVVWKLGKSQIEHHFHRR